MAKVRVFYGHEGVRFPHGPSTVLTSREREVIAETQNTVDVDEPTGETVDELTVFPDGEPDATWKVAEIDAYAELIGVEVSGTKTEKLAQLAVIRDD